MEKELLNQKLKNLEPEKLIEISKACFEFFFAFLDSISEKEDENLRKNMEEFIKKLKNFSFENLKEKKELLGNLIHEYYLKFIYSLNPKNREKFKRGIEKIVEGKLQN